MRLINDSLKNFGVVFLTPDLKTQLSLKYTVKLTLGFHPLISMCMPISCLQEQIWKWVAEYVQSCIRAAVFICIYMGKWEVLSYNLNW